MINKKVFWKKSLLYALAGFMLVAGINHFWHPGFYYPLIPDYLPFPKTINFISGFLEVFFALALLSKTYRKYAGLGIIVMLLLFIPSHIYFIQMGACVPNGLCTPLWVAWMRLLVIHPVLLAWTWYVMGIKSHETAL